MSESVNYRSLEKGTHVMNSYGDVLDNLNGHSIKLDPESRKTFIDLISVRKDRKGVLMLIDSDNITVATPINYQNKKGSRIEEGVGIYVTDDFSKGLDVLLEQTYNNINNHEGKGPYGDDLVFESFEIMDDVLKKIVSTPKNREDADTVYDMTKKNTPFMADYGGIQSIDLLMVEKTPQKIYLGTEKIAFLSR